MPKVTFVAHDGSARTVDIPVGLSVMEGALHHKVKGIEGDCGGLASCSTCHVYVADDWLPVCGPADELEREMLFFAFDVAENSRLSCQIKVEDAHDGLILHLPARQY